LLEAQKRESEIEIDKRDLKLKSSRMQLIIAGVALLLILILSYIIFKRLRITTKQKGIIEEQKDKLSTKNQEIAESVNYAKRIQDTILPSDQTVERIFRNFFILYLPKDIVSGDFYWAADTQDYYFLAVADCTGHGIPGALVSFVCSKALDKAVNEEGLIQTDEILNRTRDIVIEQFSQNNNALHDGMDISLIRVDKIELHTHENVTLQFSGANNPLWIVSKNKNDERFAGFNQREFNENSLIEIKGDKQPIGKFINMQPFNKHELLLKQGELIYLLSDGYADQFGGKNDNGKKYKSAKLKALVSSISKKELKEQKLHLTRELKEWSRNHEQVDDITIMGIEIG
jgi:serine phosphatase RsbU (regulator of sigma subunit)